MKIYKFTVGNFAVNNYLIHPSDSRSAVLIDAGDNIEPVLAKIKELDLQLVYLINTHGHADHIAGNRTILEATGANLLIHELDEPYLSDPSLNLSTFFSNGIISPPADRLLTEGENIELEGLKFRVLHTPGHSPGHLSLVCNNHAFVGDVIFQGSVGRTDFPQSNSSTLIASIRSKIYRLSDETILYPGHGPNTSVREEKASNPFVSL